MKENIDYNLIVDEILENKTYYSEYQPIVEIVSGDITAYEGLARFWHDDTVIPPNVLFDSLHDDLERLGALETAVKAFQLKHCPPDYPLFINYDPHSAVYDWAKMEATLSKRVKDNPIIFELIEDAHTIPRESQEKLFKYLDEQGFPIALDDFGKPESFFSFEIISLCDYVKIDLAWVNLSFQYQNYFDYMKAFIEFAHSLGKEVIMEGIENEQHLDLAKRLNADYVQGYLYRQKFIVVDAAI